MTARLEVICGPMFSGKTEEVIRRIKREQYANRSVLVVKPEQDDRTEAFIASREVGPDKIPSTVDRWDAHILRTTGQLWNLLEEHACDTLVIDEAQFFDSDLATKIADVLYERRFTEFLVIVAGLDQDYAQKPFGPMGDLLCMADIITKLSAVCMRCKGSFARHTQRLRGGTAQTMTGDREMYEARCRECHEPTLISQKPV